MITYIIITIITILVGIVNALKDSSALNRFKTDWWNKEKSWKRKWLVDKQTGMLSLNNKRLWYYIGIYKPKYIERFPYSSTILVWCTDGWHLLQQVQFSLVFLGKSIILFNDPLNILISFILMKVIFSISFEVVYKNLENR